LLKNTFLIIITLLLLGSSAQAQRFRETPQNAAKNFVQSLGNADFDMSWRLLSGKAKKAIAQKTIDRFEDIDNKIYQLTEMEYLLLTNAEGHRTVMFEDLTKSWCRQIGASPASLKKASASIVSQKEKRAVVKVSAGTARTTMIMVNEDGWKAEWCPK
jgi:hypothetical protein